MAQVRRHNVSFESFAVHVVEVNHRIMLASTCLLHNECQGRVTLAFLLAIGFLGHVVESLLA